MTTAKVFTHGRSQAVRLPKEFRFDADEVGIRRVGERVILEPLGERGRMPWRAIDETGDEIPDRDQPDTPPDRKVFGR